MSIWHSSDRALAKIREIDALRQVHVRDDDDLDDALPDFYTDSEDDLDDLDDADDGGDDDGDDERPSELPKNMKIIGNVWSTDSSFEDDWAHVPMSSFEGVDDDGDSEGEGESGAVRRRPRPLRPHPKMRARAQQARQRRQARQPQPQQSQQPQQPQQSQSQQSQDGGSPPPMDPGYADYGPAPVDPGYFSEYAPEPLYADPGGYYQEPVYQEPVYQEPMYQDPGYGYVDPNGYYLAGVQRMYQSGTFADGVGNAGNVGEVPATEKPATYMKTGALLGVVGMVAYNYSTNCVMKPSLRCAGKLATAGAVGALLGSFVKKA